MSEYVTDEAVERAAIATYEEMQHPNWRAPQWDEIDETGQERFLDAARAALEAAAPLIAAQALRDAADKYQTGGWADDLPVGSSRVALILGMSQRAVGWLRARADEIEESNDE